MPTRGYPPKPPPPPPPLPPSAGGAPIPPPLRGPEPARRKPLRCRLGWHDLETIHFTNEAGWLTKTVRVCLRAGCGWKSDDRQARAREIAEGGR